MGYAELVVIAIAGTCAACALLGVVLAFVTLVLRGGDDGDGVRTPPLARGFVIGSAIGAGLLATGNALAALVVGGPIAIAAAAGLAAGIVASPLSLATLLAGSTSAVALLFPLVLDAGALALAVSLGWA